MVSSPTTHKAKPAVSKGESLPVDPKLAAGNDPQVASTMPSALSHNTADGKKTPAVKNRLKAADYNPEICRILNITIHLYHVLLLTDNPFPDAHVELEYAREAWDTSSKYHQSTDIHLDTGLASLVSDAYGLCNSLT